MHAIIAQRSERHVQFTRNVPGAVFVFSFCRFCFLVGQGGKRIIGVGENLPVQFLRLSGSERKGAQFDGLAVISQIARVDPPGQCAADQQIGGRFVLRKLRKCGGCIKRGGHFLQNRGIHDQFGQVGQVVIHSDLSGFRVAGRRRKSGHGGQQQAQGQQQGKHFLHRCSSFLGFRCCINTVLRQASSRSGFAPVGCSASFSLGWFRMVTVAHSTRRSTISSARMRRP